MHRKLYSPKITPVLRYLLVVDRWNQRNRPLLLEGKVLVAFDRLLFKKGSLRTLKRMVGLLCFKLLILPLFPITRLKEMIRRTFRKNTRLRISLKQLHVIPLRKLHEG